MEIILVIVGIAFLIWLLLDSSQKKEEEEKRLELEKNKLELERERNIEAERYRVQQKKRLEELEEKKRLEELNFETVKVIKCRIVNNKPNAILRKKDNTYAFVEREDMVFRLNSQIKLKKETIANLDWFQEDEYLQREKRREKKQFKKNQEARILLQGCQLNYYHGLDEFLTLNDLNYWNIYKYNVSLLPQNLHYTTLFDSLNNGTIIIQDNDVLRNYFACYGGHHYHKLQSSCRIIMSQLNPNIAITILDYGCGQALATTVFYDYLIMNNITIKIKEVILIEPSLIALERGIYHLNKFIDVRKEKTSIKKVNKSLDNLEDIDLHTDRKNIKIHLFSNILDVATFDLEKLASKIKTTQLGDNYFICLSPYNNSASSRINQFINCFDSKDLINAPSSAFNAEIYNVMTKSWSKRQITKFQRIFKCNIKPNFSRF